MEQSADLLRRVRGMGIPFSLLRRRLVAEDKIRLAINQGVQVLEGWLIDGKGQPTTEPNDFKEDPPGAILPLGGDAGHKGYGLSIMVELLGGALSGQG